jgi:zinc transport system substrate-binding protein
VLPRRALAAAAVAAVALALTGCSRSGTSSASSSDARVKVVAAFYPLAWAASVVGGDHVDVTSLTAAGAEPHDLELSPQQVAAVTDAQMVVLIRGFQPSVDDAVAQTSGTALEVSRIASKDYPTGTAAAGGPERDPHLWLDPINMTAIVDAVRDRLISIDPAQSAIYTANAEAAVGRLVLLDTAWSAGTQKCRSRDLVVSHDAFGYLAQRYGFAQVGISGLSPDAEPSPSKIAEVTDFVRTHRITTIYYETLVDPKVAQTVASTTGATTAVLDPLEGAPRSGQDYVDVMRNNLATVRAGQGCT